MLIFETTVRDLSHKGLGVVDAPDGRVLFVRGTWPGDLVRLEVAKEGKSYIEARLLSLLKPSPDRVPVACPHRGNSPGECGGCPWMIASYPSQIIYKVKRLQHALNKRKLRLPSGVVREVIPSPEIFGYRNRVQLKTDGEKIGYVSEGTSVMAPVNDCLIMNPRLRGIFQEMKATLPREDFRPGENHRWCFVDLDDEVKIEVIVPNRRRPFRQGNTLQNEAMKDWIRKKLDGTPRHFPVIDLFCGSGNFTEVLSELGFTNILAVEVQGVALRELEKRKLPGVRILPLDMREKGSWARIARAQPHARVLLTDPPREGMEKRRGLLKYLDNLERILYISCEIDSFVRDASDLQQSFELCELTPLDLFPHTPHLEILSDFRRERPV